ncbi:MAG: dehydratase [Planctomycetota bacterium]|nr:MAG: dehydratase [Planctomycetota bacterium]
MSDVYFFEDLQPGMDWKSPGRTITESDIVAFAGLTGDYDPIHVDHEYAASTPYGKPMAHGLLGLSYLAGLSSHFPSVRTIAFVRILEWNFERPIFIGDTVHAVTEVESVSPKGRKSGEVVWFRQLINQRGERVQHGRLVTLVSSRQFLPRKSRARKIVESGNGSAPADTAAKASS